jgi:hypothetical protein
LERVSGAFRIGANSLTSKEPKKNYVRENKLLFTMISAQPSHFVASLTLCLPGHLWMLSK